MIDSRISLVIFTVLLTIVISTAANQFHVDGISCSDPNNIIEQPSENATTIDRVIGPANDIVDVFFGCSSQNPLVNGFFVSLQAGIIIVLLFIAKDLVPFT